MTARGAPRIAVVGVDDPRWRSFVESSPAATPFHHPAWTRVLVDSYGFRPFAATVTDATGAITAGIPVLEIGRVPGRRRWVSLPFTDDCAPLVGEGDAEDLLRALQAERTARRLRSIECRGPLPPAPDTHAWEAGVRHRLAVHGDLERLRAGLGKMHRRNLKTAEKGGVEVELGRGDAELRSFHRLHVLTRQRLGVPTQPPRFFKALGRFIDRDGLGFILSARVDGATVASGVFLAWNGVLVYKFGASDARNWPSRPNNLLFWVAIRWAAEHGYHTLDFGRTELENQGLRQFKLGWGAVEEPLVYTTLAAASPAPSSGRAQALAGEAIRRSPAWVGQAVGRVLYRYSA